MNNKLKEIKDVIMNHFKVDKHFDDYGYTFYTLDYLSEDSEEDANSEFDLSVDNLIIKIDNILNER